MKKYKQADCFISILLIAGFTVMSFVNRDDTFIIGYFVVGGWQLISMVVHAVFGWFTAKYTRRYVYQFIVLGIVLMAFSGLFMEYFLILLAFPLLFAAPFMAMYYTLICYKELNTLTKRPLSYLK